MTTITQHSRAVWIRRALTFYLTANQWKKVSCYGDYDIAYKKDVVTLMFQFKYSKNQKDKKNRFAIMIANTIINESNFNAGCIMEDIYTYFLQYDKTTDKRLCKKLFHISYTLFSKEVYKSKLLCEPDKKLLCSAFYAGDYTDDFYSCHRLKQLKNHTAKSIINRYYKKNSRQIIYSFMNSSKEEFANLAKKPRQDINKFYMNVISVLSAGTTLEDLKQLNLF